MPQTAAHCQRNPGRGVESRLPTPPSPHLSTDPHHLALGGLCIVARVVEAGAMDITTPTQPIRTPGDILANIPGILGFFPTESVILISIQPSQRGYSIGPVARLDLHDVPGALHEVMDAFHCGNPEIIFCFVLSQREEGELWDILQSLYHFQDRTGMGIDACWLSEELSTNTAYDLIFGHATEGGEGPLQNWMEGTIPAISTSHTMRACVNNGMLPELSRHDLVQRFKDPNPYFGEEEIRAMERCAEEIARQLRAGHGYGTTDPVQVVKHLIADARYVLSEVESLEETLENEELLCVAAMWMSTTWTRDLVITELVSAPREAGDLLLAVARTFQGPIRYNALALYAASQVSDGFGIYAGPALSVVVEEAPHHNLGRLIAQGYRSGMGKRLVSSLCHGCELAREAAGLRVDSPA